jgi:hypothetical protein
MVDGSGYFLQLTQAPWGNGSAWGEQLRMWQWVRWPSLFSHLQAEQSCVLWFVLYVHVSEKRLLGVSSSEMCLQWG